MVSNAQHVHLSYLLRVWRAGNSPAPEWRCLLEDTRTRERRGFADLASLLAFLEQQIGEERLPQPGAKPSGTAPE